MHLPTFFDCFVVITRRNVTRSSELALRSRPRDFPVWAVQSHSRFARFTDNVYGRFRVSICEPNSVRREHCSVCPLLIREPNHWVSWLRIDCDTRRLWRSNRYPRMSPSVKQNELLGFDGPWLTRCPRQQQSRE